MNLESAVLEQALQLSPLSQPVSGDDGGRAFPGRQIRLSQADGSSWRTLGWW